MEDAMKEIEAMRQVAEVLAELEEDAVERVLRWAAGYRNVVLGSVMKTATQHDDEDRNGMSSRGFERFSDLFDAVDPTDNPRRALVAGYWLQHVGGADSFTGREINDLLKALGHELSNVTVAFNSLQGGSPKLARQISKAKGTAGHKRYRLTDAGVNRIDALLRGEDDG